MGNREKLLNEIAELYPMLLSLSRKYCRNREDAEDLRAETICKMIEHLENFDPSRAVPLRAFICIILKNTFITWLKKQRCRPKEQEAVLRGCAVMPDDWKIDLDIIRNECRFDEVFLSSSGYSYEEISKSKGVPLGTTKSRIHNERERLKKILNFRRI